MSMPTYEYACTSCGHHLEVVQSFTDEPLTKCERCGGELRRVFHPVGVLFKGSGFYSTDSRRKKAKSASGDSKKTTEEAGSKGSTGGKSSTSPSAKSESSGPSDPADKPSGSSSKKSA